MIEQGVFEDAAEGDNMEGMMDSCEKLVGHLNSIGPSGYMTECINKENGMSLLDLICYTENEQMLKVLADKATYFEDIVNHGSEINGGWTPLLWAAQRGNLEIAQLLVRKNANISQGK
jgi:hypothetical protein